MDLHHQYAVRIRNASSDVYMYGNPGWRYIAEGEDGEFTLTTEESEAASRWTRSLASRMADDYLKKAWNVTMGSPPEFEVVKVHRPQKIYHPW